MVSNQRIKELDDITAIEDAIRDKKSLEEKEEEPTEIKTLDLKDMKQIEDIISTSVKEEKEAKELFSKKDIETKTDVSRAETSIIARLKFLCDELGLENFRKALIYLMELRASKDRKSRKEYIDALQKQGTMFGMNNGGNLGGFNNGRMG